MLSSTMKYGAIRAKVMAMQGKMLSNDDFNRLCECKDIPDAANFLRNHDGWSETITTISSPITPQKLKSAVLNRLWKENEKLYRFSNINDKSFLKFLTAKGEYGLVLSASRRLGSLDNGYNDSDGEPENRAAEFLRQKSTVNARALETCNSWRDLLEAVSGSIFADSLRNLELNPETQLPNYRELSITLENAYYREVFSYVTKKYNALGKQKIKELLGREADYLNLVSILRLHRYFPASLQNAGKLLIPISYKLRPEMVTALVNAQGEAEALSILKETKYGQSFGNVEGQRLEAIYENAMSDLCRKIVNTAEPSACTAPAYLTLKELECKKIVRVIESISAGIDPKSVI